jgi:hypothetical protein
METVNAQFIAGIDTLSGNAPVDFVVLKDGRVIGIDAECVVLYASMDDFYSFDTVDRASFSLTEGV